MKNLVDVLKSLNKELSRIYLLEEKTGYASFDLKQTLYILATLFCTH
jgi:hypothetical protein